MGRVSVQAANTAEILTKTELGLFYVCIWCVPHQRCKPCVRRLSLICPSTREGRAGATLFVATTAAQL